MKHLALAYDGLIAMSQAEPGDEMVGEIEKVVLEAVAGEAVKHGGRFVLKSFRKWLDGLQKAKHPSLNELREICDWLGAFLPPPNQKSSSEFQFPLPSQQAHFRRHDMSAQEIFDLWFRTDTPLWRKRIEKSADQWCLLSASKLYYFTGQESVSFIYDDRDINRRLRHPIFRAVHPFIMLSRVSREKLGEDPLGKALDLSVDSWLAFTLPEYTEFRRGTAVILSDQAFTAGSFKITSRSQFRWRNEYLQADVSLRRLLMVSATAWHVDIMNVGIPTCELDDGRKIGGEFDSYFKTWMKGFRAC